MKKASVVPHPVTLPTASLMPTASFLAEQQQQGATTAPVGIGGGAAAAAGGGNLMGRKNDKGKENATGAGGVATVGVACAGGGRASNKGTLSTPEEQAAKKLLEKYAKKIQYSDKYSDELFEYRHVTLPRKEALQIIKDFYAQVAFAPTLKRLWEGSLLTEAEWRSIGVVQSLGWDHYAFHRPEPHILLFRRQLAPSLQPQRKDATVLSAKIEKIFLH